MREKCFFSTEQIFVFFLSTTWAINENKANKERRISEREDIFRHTSYMESIMIRKGGHCQPKGASHRISMSALTFKEKQVVLYQK